MTHPQARFSAAAGTYDAVAHVQRHVADHLVRKLSTIATPQRVLDVGCGTGRLTRRLADLWPQAWVEGVDFAVGMIEQARQQVDGEGRPCFTLADAVTFAGTPPHTPYDLLVSSSSLQWMPPLDRTLAHLAGLVRQDGSFAFAVMLDHTLHELQTAQAQAAPGMTLAVTLPSSPAMLTALSRAGLVCTDAAVADHVVHADSASALLHDLRAVGVTGGLDARRSPLTRRQLRQVCEYYDANFRDATGVVATYRVGFYRGHRIA